MTNNRIVNNKLITSEEDKENQVGGRALSRKSETASSSVRQGRILMQSSSDSSPGSQQGAFRRVHALGTPSPTRYPAFYYRKYYNNERVGVIAESSFEEDNIPTSSEQVVSYSYLAAPEGHPRLDKSTSKDVVYGSGTLAKPPSQSSPVVIFESSKTKAPNKAAFKTQPKTAALLQRPVADSKSSHLTQGFEPSLFGSSASLATSISNAVPFGHSTSAPASFAVHHVSSPAQLLQNHPPHAPPAVFQSNPNDFVIQDTIFQAHPGAPTFTLPIPIPTQQTKRRRQPSLRNQLQASSEVQEYFVSASGETPSFASYDPYQQEASTKKPIYQKMMEPLMRAGEQIYKMASPVLNPMINAGQRISQRLRIPERMSDASEYFSFNNMNNYISRAADGGAIPIAAGAIAAAALGITALAAAASTEVSIARKRSIDDPAEEYIYQILDPYPMGEQTLLDRLEQYTSWTNTKCSKRIFCDVMTFVSDDQLYTIEKRLDMFLRLLNRGSAEESALKRTASDVMQAVRRRQCDVFSCGGSEVDPSKVSRTSAGPR
ncbi:hypothetical protein SK128_017838 [Halocaridina rubra]|uniref:Uncharacterized protein n=1 Tax=Halocaridina rubra TaxID=373956 RepID=A0AAN8XRF3_HALRR